MTSPSAQFCDLRSSALIRGSFAVFLLCTLTAQAAPDSAGLEFFEKKIRPVLVERCYKCHSAESEKLRGNLHLDTPEGIKKGGESGKPAIIPGDPDRSILIEAIRYKNEDLQMPPKQRLTDPQAWAPSLYDGDASL